MALFKPSTELTADESVVALTEQIEALTTENKSLLEFKANTEKLKQLQAKSADLGFKGDVEAILTESKFDMGTAMGSLITAFSTEVSARKAVFTEQAADADTGDAGEDLDVAEPKTKTEAINLVRAQHDLKGASAIRKANQLFPKLWE